MKIILKLLSAYLKLARTISWHESSTLEHHINCNVWRRDAFHKKMLHGYILFCKLQFVQSQPLTADAGHHHHFSCMLLIYSLIHQIADITHRPPLFSWRARTCTWNTALWLVVIIVTTVEVVCTNFRGSFRTWPFLTLPNLPFCNYKKANGGGKK